MPKNFKLLRTAKKGTQNKPHPLQKIHTNFSGLKQQNNIQRERERQRAKERETETQRHRE